MNSKEAEDTFIGRLFSRIKPKTSYAAFPWRSWGDVCTVLETIRGRGVRVKRSRNAAAWELDATTGRLLDAPHAYAVYVHDPDEDDSGTAETLPAVMRGDSKPTAYVYCPYFADEDAKTYDVVAGANSARGVGVAGDTADEPDGDDFTWGWKALDGEVKDRGSYVVYGVMKPVPGNPDAGAQFAEITLAAETAYLQAVTRNADRATRQIVPIAAIASGRVVQLLFGRPWSPEPLPLPFEVRAVENDAGEARLAIYLPGSQNDLVFIARDRSKHDASGDGTTALSGKWFDLGAMPSSDSTVYLYFVDKGWRERPRYQWRLGVIRSSAGTASLPDVPINILPIRPIATYKTPSGAITQLHTGAVWVDYAWDDLTGDGGLPTERWLYGPNGEAVAGIDDEGSPSFGVSGDFRVAGDAALAGKLNDKTPTWRTISIDGTNYTVLVGE